MNSRMRPRVHEYCHYYAAPEISGQRSHNRSRVCDAQTVYFRLFSIRFPLLRCIYIYSTRCTSKWHGFAFFFSLLFFSFFLRPNCRLQVLRRCAFLFVFLGMYILYIRGYCRDKHCIFFQALKAV